MHKFNHTQYKHSFTLVEMLIVIVIIGILSVAIIPKVMGLQARARDTARSADLRTINNAMEVYHIDHGQYPIANFNAFVSRELALRTLIFPSVYAQNNGSSIASLSVMDAYLKQIPVDPKGLGIKSTSDGSCIAVGNSYGYYTNNSGSIYSITSVSESQKGNTATCGNVIDRNSNGGYQKEGVGLVYDVPEGDNNIVALQETDPSCFGIVILLSSYPGQEPVYSRGGITSYSNNCPKDVVIPGEINEITVQAIQPNAFLGKQLTSVVIPASVENMGNKAFTNNNSLTSVIV